MLQFGTTSSHINVYKTESGLTSLRTLGLEYAETVYSFASTNSVQVDFKRSLIDVFIDDVLIKSLEDPRMEDSYIYGLEVANNAAVTNLTVEQYPLLQSDDVTFNASLLPSFTKVSTAGPVFTGGTFNTVDNDFLNFEVIDTNGKPGSYTARFAVVLSTDHGGVGDEGVYLAWADDPELTNLTNFSKIINNGETPRIVWDEGNSQWICYYHKQGWPSAGVQTTASSVSTDLVTWTDEQVALDVETHPVSYTDAEPEHSGYASFWLDTTSNKMHATSIYNNYTGNPDKLPLEGNGMCWVSPAGNYRSFSLNGARQVWENTPLRMINKTGYTYYKHRGQLLYLGAIADRAADWSLPQPQQLAMRTMSDDLTRMSSQHQVIYEPEVGDWDEGMYMVPLGHVEYNGFLWFYYRAYTPGSSNPYEVGLLKADIS